MLLFWVLNAILKLNFLFTIWSGVHNSITKKAMFFVKSEMRLKPFGCKEQDELFFDKAGHIKTPRKSSIGIHTWTFLGV